MGPNGTRYNTAEVLVKGDASWTNITDTIPMGPLNYFSGINLNDKVYFLGEFQYKYSSLFYNLVILFLLGGFNAINYFYTILEFDTSSETWQEVSNMRSARGGPGVSVIDFNEVKDFVSNCYTGTGLIDKEWS